MNKDNFEKSFEQQWQEAFDGAELSPKTNLWDKIEAQLASPAAPAEVGKYGYFFSMGLLIFLSTFFIQSENKFTQNIRKQPASAKTNPIAQNNKQTGFISAPLNPHEAIGQESPQNTLPTNRITIARGQESYKNTLPTNHPSTPLPTNFPSTLLPVHLSTPLPTNHPSTLPPFNPSTPLPTNHSSTLQPFNPSTPLPTNHPSTLQPFYPSTPLPTNHPSTPIKQQTQYFRQKLEKALQKESAVEALVPLAMRLELSKEPKLKSINFVFSPELVPPTVRLKNFWIGVQRGVTLSPTKLDINYTQYLADYAQVHKLTDGVNLTDFFTEINEKAHFSVGNQADIRFGYHFSPRWQFITGIQYRVEFLEQTTNAFFVNYYDYSRHSFLLDILEGNIDSPDFAQALQNHPTYNPQGENNFRVSQFNQEGLINLSSRFEYIGIPIQFGYTVRPFKKLGFTVLAAGQVDKLTSSNTASYELKDDVTTAYKLETATKISTWSWQIGGGLQAEYRYDTRWALTANSLILQNIKSIQENKYVAVRPRGLQLNLGAKYMF